MLLRYCCTWQQHNRVEGCTAWSSNRSKIAPMLNTYQQSNSAACCGAPQQLIFKNHCIGCTWRLWGLQMGNYKPPEQHILPSIPLTSCIQQTAWPHLHHD
eukprot:1139993-Pelagomonas_calceolata.AAC.4